MRSLLIAALLIASPILQALELTPYTASYHFNLDNKLSGTATRILENTGNNNWRYTFTATTAIASATETSNFRFDGKKVSPVSYKRKHKVLFISKNTEVSFDWKNKKATTRRDDKQGFYALKNGAVDPLNFEVQMRRDIIDAGNVAKAYLIADPKRMNEQKFVIDGDEVIDTPYGKISTIRVKRIHEDPERHTTFWLARDLDYIPAKVIQDDDGAIYTLQLNSLTGALAKAELPPAPATL